MGAYAFKMQTMKNANYGVPKPRHSKKRDIHILELSHQKSVLETANGFYPKDLIRSGLKYVL